MAQLSKLHDRLNKVVSDAETVTRYGRVLEFVAPQTGLSTLAEEIEETRFERRLLFRNERHEEFGMHVVAGRILRVTACDLAPSLHARQEDAYVELVGQDLSSDTPETLLEVAKALQAFCDNVKILYVKAQPPPQSLQHQSIGVSLDMILAPCASAPAPIPDQPVRLAEFAEHASADATALLHIAAQDVAAAHGQETALQALLDLAESELQFRAREAAEGRSPDAQEHCIILESGTDKSGQAILCATCGEDLVFVTFPSNALHVMFEHWRDSKKPV